jgi:hypothetical protein
MTWKLYALTSGGGAVVVTYLASFMAPIGRPPDVPTVVPQAVDRSGEVVDLGAQADRLKIRLAEVTAYRKPARDAFRFAEPRRRVDVAPRTFASAPPPGETVPARPPYGLSGMAITIENGVSQRTAILSSLQGVALVKEGDELDAGYRVLTITDETVTLESTGDGAQTTLRLSNPN